MDNDRRQAKSGVFWFGINRGISFFAAFISSIVLARILDPSDFGTVALATAVAMVFNRLSTIGLSPELMRLKKDDPEYSATLSTYFWVNLGLVICVFTLVSGGVWLSSFLQQEAFVIFLVIYAGWSLNSLFGIGRVLLYQRMYFRTVSFLDFLPAICAAVLAVAMALSSCGIWSLVIPQLLFMLIATMVAFKMSGFWPVLCFQKQAAKRLIKKTPWYIANSFAVEGFQRIDDIILGKLAGDIALGFYQRAYYMSSMFHKNIGTVLKRTLIPFLFHHVEDESRMERMYAYAVKLIIYVIGTALCLLLVYCSEIIVLLLTAKWLPCVPIFYTIAIYVIMLPLFHVNKEFAIAQDDIRQMSRISVENFVILLILLFPCVSWGAGVGAALAVNLAMMYGLLRVMFLVRKRCPFNFRKVYVRPMCVCVSGFLLACCFKGVLKSAVGDLGGMALNMAFILAWIGGSLFVFERRLLGLFFERKS